MANKLMYHAHNYALQEAAPEAVERLLETGWREVQPYDLIAVYHEGLNDHKTVHKADAQAWVNRGYYAEPTVVYHPEKGSRTVSGEHAKQLLAEGWFDTPAKFPTANVTVAGFTAPIIRPAAQSVPLWPFADLSAMTKAEIVTHAEDALKLKLELTGRETKDQLIDAVLAHQPKE